MLKLAAQRTGIWHSGSAHASHRLSSYVCVRSRVQSSECPSFFPPFPACCLPTAGRPQLLCEGCIYGEASRCTVGHCRRLGVTAGGTAEGKEEAPTDQSGRDDCRKPMTSTTRACPPHLRPHLPPCLPPSSPAPHSTGTSLPPSRAGRCALSLCKVRISPDGVDANRVVMVLAPLRSRAG